MKSILFSVLSVSLFALKGLAADILTVNTPAAATECEPLQITWTGGTGPFFVTITAAGAPNGAPLETFPQAAAPPITWLVNLAANTQLVINCRDSLGAISQSAPFTIQPGVSTACVGASGSSSVGVVTTAASSAAGSPAATTAAATPATTKGNNNPTTSASTATTSAKSSSSNAAAAVGDVSYGVVGVIGAVVAAVLA